MLDAVTSSKTTGKSSKQSMALSQNPSKKSNTFLQRLCVWFGNRRKNLYRKWLKTISKLRTLFFIYFVGLSVWGFFFLAMKYTAVVPRTHSKQERPGRFQNKFHSLGNWWRTFAKRWRPLNIIIHYRGKTWYGSNIRLCSYRGPYPSGCISIVRRLIIRQLDNPTHNIEKKWKLNIGFVVVKSLCTWCISMFPSLIMKKIKEI